MNIIEDKVKLKKCGGCKEIKNYSEFNKCKTGTFGLHNHCRECQKKNKAKWDLENADRIKEYSQREDVKTRARNSMKKKYHSDENYRIKTLEKNKIRRRNEPAKIKQRINEKNRLKNNPHYKIRHNLNNRLRSIIKNINSSKAGSIVEIVGCSICDLIKYIESLWKPGMSWENYGTKGWHIDHIIPCIAFNLSIPEEQKKCYHYTNLQPLWAYENLSKGCKVNGVDIRLKCQ